MDLQPSYPPRQEPTRTRSTIRRQEPNHKTHKLQRAAGAKQRQSDARRRRHQACYNEQPRQGEAAENKKAFNGAQVHEGDKRVRILRTGRPHPAVLPYPALTPSAYCSLRAVGSPPEPSQRNRMAAHSQPGSKGRRSGSDGARGPGQTHTEVGGKAISGTLSDPTHPLEGRSLDLGGEGRGHR